MATFKQLRSDVFYNTILDVDGFAETFLVHEPGKDDRQVIGKKSTDDADMVIIEQYLEQEKEALLVRFGKNEAHPKGGIVFPQRGLTIAREGEESAPYAYTGKKMHAAFHSWTLVFVRPLLRKVEA